MADVISHRQTPYELDFDRLELIKNAEGLKNVILKNLEERRALNVKVFANHPLAHYIIVAEHLMEPNLRATASHISHLVRQTSDYLSSCEGMKGSNWVILDFQDVILHLFTQESREHYSITDLLEKHEVSI